MLRKTDLYPLCGHGDINLYAVFAECMRNRLALAGRVGCVLPSGIVTDDTTKLFFQDVAETGALVSVFDFENTNQFFPQVDRNTKFCLFTTGSLRPSKLEKAQFVCGVKEIAELKDPGRQFSLSGTDIKLMNPNTRTCPLFRSRKDADLTRAVYNRIPILANDRGPDPAGWRVTFYRMFDMANDSGLFAADDLNSENQTELNRQTSVRVYEGKMFHQFNHRFASASEAETGQKLRGASEESSERDLTDPIYTPKGRYLIDKHDLPDWSRTQTALLVFRRVGGVVANVRTMVSAILPLVGCGDSVFVMQTEGAPHKLLLCANLNSFVLDYILRNKMSGINLNYFIVKQLPVLPPATFTQKCPWASNQQDLQSWLLPRVVELTYTAWDLVALARECGVPGPPFQWNEERRFLLRCELDAAHFHLYGINRDDVGYIMETFPIVMRRDIEKDGEYRTKRVILEIFDEMTEAIRAGVAYKPRLHPPSTDPSCRHPRFKVGILAFGSLIFDPGEELKKVIRMRLKTVTPFPVEFGRYSRTRGGAPTLVKHEAGSPVAAEILVLEDVVSIEAAIDMLWRRERRKVGSGEKYEAGASRDTVLVQETESLTVSSVIYTDFPQAGKILSPTAQELAACAIESVKRAKTGHDGITYLMKAIAVGIMTPLTADYREAVLQQSGTRSLEEALERARTN